MLSDRNDPVTARGKSAKSRQHKQIQAKRFSAAAEKNRPFSAAIGAAKRNNNRPYNGANLMNLASSVDLLNQQDRPISAGTVAVNNIRKLQNFFGA